MKIWATNEYGATGFRLFVADVVLTVELWVRRLGERLDKLHERIDPVFMHDER